MIVKDLNFVITDKNEANYVVQYDDIIRLEFLRFFKDSEIKLFDVIEGKIKGVYKNSDHEYQIVILVNDEKLFDINVSDIKDWSIV